MISQPTSNWIRLLEMITVSIAAVNSDSTT